MDRIVRFRRRSADRHGQALVEFSIAAIPFLILLMGILDLGRAIYQLNTTSEASREIARATSLHEWSTCCDLGSSPETAQVVSVQRALLPGFDFSAPTDIVCVDITDAVIPDVECRPGDFVRVTVRSTFSPATPLTMMFGAHTFSSTSRIEIP